MSNGTIKLSANFASDQASPAIGLCSFCVHNGVCAKVAVARELQVLGRTLQLEVQEQLLNSLTICYEKIYTALKNDDLNRFNLFYCIFLHDIEQGTE